LGGHEPKKYLTVTREDYDRALASVCDSGSADVQLIMLGCPHYALDEIKEVAELLKGKKVAEGVTLQIWTDMTIQQLAEVNGYAQTIRDAGAHLLNSACPLVCGRTAYDRITSGFLTDGAKQAHYIHTDLNSRNCKVFFGDTKRCVEAAIKGSVPGRRRFPRGCGYFFAHQNG
jgi:predicted aconitase